MTATSASPASHDHACSLEYTLESRLDAPVLFILLKSKCSNSLISQRQPSRSCIAGGTWLTKQILRLVLVLLSAIPRINASKIYIKFVPQMTVMYVAVAQWVSLSRFLLVDLDAELPQEVSRLNAVPD
jgi:hypothetical protein